MSAAAALVVAVALAGCGSTTYFAGRTLPPSGLSNRVLIAVQNPNGFTQGALVFVDAYYDIRYAYNNVNKTFSIAGYSGALPATIQNMPEEETGAVYSSGDGHFTFVNYSKETAGSAQTGLNGTSSSIFTTRNQSYIFAASQAFHVLTVLDKTSGGTYALNLPGVYHVSVNAGGSAALAFVQNSNYVYYAQKLTAAQTIAYSGGPSSWPKAAQGLDCEPQSAPVWCVLQAQSPNGTPLTFDRPIKAVFSADGGTAYVLNCGPECGGTAASVSALPVAPMIFLQGQQSGTLPVTTNTPSTQCGTVNIATGCIPTPGGASNALVASSTLYVVGQSLQSDGFFGGYLTVLDTSKSPVAVSSPVSISDGAPGGPSRMILADDNTLWIGMTKCNSGERIAHSLPYGCLTMFNTTTNSATLLEPFFGDATGIAAITGFHKIYTAEGGQVYIYSTVDGSSIDNQYVTVTGTATDVAYMDAVTDDNNTLY